MDACRWGCAIDFSLAYTFSPSMNMGTSTPSIDDLTFSKASSNADCNSSLSADAGGVRYFFILRAMTLSFEHHQNRRNGTQRRAPEAPAATSHTLHDLQPRSKTNALSDSLHLAGRCVPGSRIAAWACASLHGGSATPQGREAQRDGHQRTEVGEDVKEVAVQCRHVEKALHRPVVGRQLCQPGTWMLGEDAPLTAAA